VKHQQHQGRHQKADRAFHQRRETGGSCTKQIPAAARISFRFLGPEAGENRRCAEETQRNIEDDGAGIHQKERRGGQHDGGERRTTDTIFPPAEKIGQTEHTDAKSRRWDARGGLRISKTGKRQGDGLEIKSGFVEIGNAIVSGSQPRTRHLHFPRHLGVPAFVRLQEWQVT